jgi:hypothetical protein
LAEVTEGSLEASDDPLTRAEFEAWTDAVVVFASIRRVLAAAALVVVFTWLAELAATAEEARSALLTDGVFNDAAEVRCVVLTAPRRICAEEEWLMASAAPEIRQTAMIFLVFIIPLFLMLEDLFVFISAGSWICYPPLHKKTFPDLGRSSRVRKGG